MPPTPDCLPQLDVCRLRVARVDPSSGVPIPGANNLYVSDALVTLDYKWVVEAGDEIKEKDGCGQLAVYYKSADSFLRGDLTITIITPDPQLSELLSAGGVTISDSGTADVPPAQPGNAVGFAAPHLGAVSDQHVISLEVWTKRVRSGKLDPSYPYAHWVYPWVMNMKPGDHQHGAKNLGATFVAEAYENSNWEDGPVGDWPGTSDRVYQWLPVTSMPAASCGYQTMVAS